MAYNSGKLLSEVDALLTDKPHMRLSDIAGALGVDRHTIENAMRAHRKTTFREHRRRRLLQDALRLLFQSHLSVKEIGIRLGYTSAASFSRFIFQATGKSPSRLRSEGDSRDRDGL